MEVVMKEWLKWGGVVLLATIVGLAFAVGFASSRLTQLPIVAAQRASTPSTPYTQSRGYGWDGGYGPDWMGRGMMGGYYGHMGGYRGWAYSNSSTPLTLDQAVEAPISI